MKMNGEFRVPTDRETVWRALNDPEVLKACLPGCQEIEKTSETEMTATLALKVGPVKATFAGGVTLSDLDPPNGYTLSGQGQGGAAGFASGEARVRLEGGKTAAGRWCTTTWMRRSAASSRRSARASSIPPPRSWPSSSSTASPRSWAAARRRRRPEADQQAAAPDAPELRRPPAQPEPPAEPAPAPADAPAESAPAEDAPADPAGPPLAPAAQRMGLPTAAWAAAVVVVAVVLILVFTGVI